MAWVRGSVVSVLVVVGLAVLTASPASAVSSASLGEVTCVEEQGQVELTVVADPEAPGPVTFLYFLDGASTEDPVPVEPGEQLVIPLGDLEDGTHTLEVDALERAEDEEYGIVFQSEFEVLCDPAPEGPYTNPKADLHQGCGPQGDLVATNRPIGGNTEDLQPVTFVVTATSDGVTKTLAEFTLPDEVDNPYTHTAEIDLSEYLAPEQPDSGVEFLPGVSLSVTANGEEIAALDQLYGCVVLPTSAGGGGGPAVVNTGA